MHDHFYAPLGVLDVICQCGEVRRPEDVAAFLAHQVAEVHAKTQRYQPFLKFDDTARGFSTGGNTHPTYLRLSSDGTTIPVKDFTITYSYNEV